MGLFVVLEHDSSTSFTCRKVYGVHVGKGKVIQQGYIYKGRLEYQVIHIIKIGEMVEVT